MPSLYQRILGDQFEKLSPVLQRFHGGTGDSQGRGQFRVSRSTSSVGYFIGMLMGLPSEGERIEVHLEVQVESDRETWIRNFGLKKLVTVQKPWKDLLLERSGPLSFAFELVVEEGGLRFIQRRSWFLGLPILDIWAPKVAATAVPEGRGWNVDVGMQLPILGNVVRYRGHIEPL